MHAMHLLNCLRAHARTREVGAARDARAEDDRDGGDALLGHLGQAVGARASARADGRASGRAGGRVGNSAGQCEAKTLQKQREFGGESRR